MDIYEIFFKNLIPDVKEFLVSDGFQVPPRPPTENNHQGNQRGPLVINAAEEAEKNIITIKAALQPSIRRRHTKTFMGVLVGNTST